MTTQNPLHQSVVSLAGIGAQSALKLEKLGIKNQLDLLFHLPHRYQDKTKTQAIGALQPGSTALISGTIELTDIINHGRKSLICRISDHTGFISLRFFYFSAQLQRNLEAGKTISCFGEVRYGYNGLEMIHPEYKIISSPEQVITEDRLTPVYPLTEGLKQNTLRKAIAQVLDRCLKNPALLTDWLPDMLLANHHYPSLLQALHTLHAPTPDISLAALENGQHPALKRLAFEELLSHHLILRTNKLKAKAWQAPKFEAKATHKQHFLQNLPFRLTDAQLRVITEIEQDCQLNQPMMRLVQGDVGSGKTIVAAYAALMALSNGYQVAIMAPTELLAEQHWRNFQQWFNQFQTQIVFITGQLKGNAKKETLAQLADGTAGISIGTHALFQDHVHFHKLGLIIIDEQHRFGVHQRMALREKGEDNNTRPHQLVMTATPIPRTLAMLQYSDLDISIIDQLPPGRKPVTTSVIPAEKRDQVISRIKHWVEQNRQAYWVCTLIEESEVLQCEAAEKTAQYLTEELPGTRVGLVHGRMKSAEKDAVMQAFKSHQLDLLVATTVIEVGVDVPNASLMIIENPERLGLSQLHQLRGRVGRGDQESYCLLMYQSPLSDTARHRLGVLRDSNDGFVIAEKDLELRGPGEVMGTRQTGQMQFKIADLARDSDLLDNIPLAAEQISQQTPDAIQPLIDRWLGSSTQYAEV